MIYSHTPPNPKVSCLNQCSLSLSLFLAKTMHFQNWFPSWWLFIKYLTCHLSKMKDKINILQRTFRLSGQNPIFCTKRSVKHFVTGGENSITVGYTVVLLPALFQDLFLYSLVGLSSFQKVAIKIYMHSLETNIHKSYQFPT